MTTVVLPWPPKALSPNARTHWRAKAPVTAAYKRACRALAMEAGLRVPEDVDSDSQRLHLWLEFYPPDRRARDDDNMIASFKAGRDGIAQAMHIDDKRFICHPIVMEQVGGFVKARVTAYMEAQKNEG